MALVARRQAAGAQMPACENSATRGEVLHPHSSDFYHTRVNPERRRRNHIRQLEALGYKVILEPAA